MSRRPLRKFPLLRLPRLALIEVVKCWNPIEIYLFSRVSRKTKEISKLVKIPCLKLGLTVYNCYEVNLGYPASCMSKNWYFRLYPGLRNYERYKNERYLDIYSKNAGKSVGKLIDHCLEIFGCEFRTMRAFIYPIMKSSNLNVFMNWINHNEKLSKIPYLSAFCLKEGNQLYLNWFMQNLKKDIGVLDLPQYYYETERSMKVRGSEIMLRVNGKVDDLRFQSREKFVDLDYLIRMDCVYMRGGETTLTNRDLNVFMKSWKEMKTNERMEFYSIIAKEKLNWRVILEGLDGEIRDVRTVRREYTYPWNKTYKLKVNGGVDITRTDGKVATIGMTFHMIYQDEPLSREMIRDYQRLIQNMEREEMDMNFVHDPEYKLTAELRKAFFVMVK
ncbi:hypothetical protein GCK72_003444 [Caenorhabditis remanei]|uniref:Sdz-33 F-box domain-containing protein n=1 Tax=Caenorhabditis remanei TaxID=31234 RepID=A0A6A5HY79_CAERE|nr:hypothetical protein GCK72_003444 [Caenorhabditis remanei]KAF1771617.1 hypothetical protein GCK72_003444 [Caenorhabditis remanei]